jgi:hypothetical protein
MEIQERQDYEVLDQHRNTMNPCHLSGFERVKNPFPVFGT